MMDVIGVRRIFILVVLLILNVSIGVLTHLYLAPMQEDSENALTRVKRDVRGLESDLDRLKIEFEQLDEQQNRFDALKVAGFFDNQERSNAKEIFNIVQAESKVISAVVNVRSGVVEDNQEAQKAKHKILFSPVEIEIESFDDSDIYRYIDLAQAYLPGHLSLDQIEISRVRDVTPPVLRAIASGASTVLVKAKLKMSWRTIIPESQVIVNDGKRNR